VLDKKPYEIIAAIKKKSGNQDRLEVSSIKRKFDERKKMITNKKGGTIFRQCH
jgi:hypothetical protein